MAAGQFEAGFAQLQTLATQHPENAQYRNAFKMQQNLQLANWLSQADKHLQMSEFDVANALYQQVLGVDADNARAKAGLNQLVVAHSHASMLANAQAAFDSQDLEAAQTTLRAILAEDANHTGARSLFERIEKQRIEKKAVSPKITSAFKQPITLELKNVPIKTLFNLIGKTANLNFTFDAELRDDQQTSLYVRNTSIDEAIEVILTTNQLRKKVLNDNTLLIYPINRSQEYEEQFVRSFYLNNLEAKRAMNLIKTVVKSKDVYIDEKLNTLVMRDSAEAIQVAEKLIASQDFADPEVMLEVEVMEINRRNLEEIGIKYPSQVGLGVQGQSTGALTPGRLTLAELKSFNSGLGVFTITDPVLALNLLQQDTDTNLLANPKIRVKNRDKAKIHVGDKIPVLTSVANSTGFVSQTVSYIDVGIKLDVEPTIMLQNQVNIKVGLEVSNVTDQVKTDSGVLAYTIGSRNANTTLNLNDGETQILAGLFRDDSQNITNKVPGLANLPLIGRLFTNKNNDKRKNEIVLLITPRILHNISPAKSVYTSFPSGINHGVSSPSNRANQAPEPLANAITPPVQTPQAVQIEKSRVDADFANQLMQPAQSGNGQ
ncbi:MAG: type II and III secretion system protein [Methylotenera sp.]|nr:MAG: type II and III secretion system protein [Methylotenera sp.]